MIKNISTTYTNVKNFVTLAEANLVMSLLSQIMFKKMTSKLKKNPKRRLRRKYLKKKRIQQEMLVWEEILIA